MNELASPMREEEAVALRQKLFNLLAHQVRQYTGGESTSLPVETAQALFQSVCFSLGLDPEQPALWRRELLEDDLAERWRAGQARIRDQLTKGKELWRIVCASLPPADNRAMRDTLRSIGGFWRRYDPRFFAQEIPCDIDYQLALPVPSKQQGVDYVVTYLERLAVENRFLQRYSPEVLCPVWEAYCPNYRQEVGNLFEPVGINALGKILLGQSQERLTFSPEERAALADLFRYQRREVVIRRLERAARGLAGEERVLCGYLTACAIPLAGRICALGEAENLAGVFL